MDEFTIEALFILFVAVLPCGISGYLIAFKERRGLISGYTEDNFCNPQAFGKSVGLSLIFLSICLTGIAYYWHLKAVTENEMALYVLFFVFCVLLNYVYAIVKYRKKS
jgi:hypothetical protein